MTDPTRLTSPRTRLRRRFSQNQSPSRRFSNSPNSPPITVPDKSIMPLLPRLLGKQFFKKRKLPVQIDLKKKNWKEQVERACSSAMLFLRTGTCSVLKVGKWSMERDEIVENVVAAIDGVVEIVPKKWANVRSFHVKLLDSVALPVYQVVPDVKLKIEGVRDVEAAVEKDEKVRGGKDEKKKKKNKKGRIHEIKYMDDKMSEDGDGDNNDTIDDYENGERESGELVSKKRKKGIKVKKGASSELGSVKQSKESAKKKMKKDGLVVKAAEEVLIKKSKNKLLVEDEGLGKKKRVDGKVKVKKSKKAA